MEKRLDIVERLRAGGPFSQPWHVRILIEAADEIEKLRAENFALAAHQCFNVSGDESGTPICKESKRLMEENERLRMALAWYRDEAIALSKNVASGAHTQAVLASVTVLSLDAGRRATEALQ